MANRDHPACLCHLMLWTAVARTAVQYTTAKAASILEALTSAYTPRSGKNNATAMYWLLGDAICSIWAPRERTCERTVAVTSYGPRNQTLASPPAGFASKTTQLTVRRVHEPC